MANENAVLYKEKKLSKELSKPFGFDELEEKLQSQLEDERADMQFLAEEKEKKKRMLINNINVNKNAFDRNVNDWRVALPEELAELALFLASDAANHMAGEVIVCDGGESLR